MKVVFNRSAPSGNIFSIIGQAAAVLADLKEYDSIKEMVHRVTHSGSYEDALAIIAEYVELEEEG